MSIASYTELKTAVANWLADSTLTDYIPDFIALGEARIYRDLRISAMETALSDTIASGVIATPTGYLELKHAYIDGSPTYKLQRKSTDFIYENYPSRSADGVPKFIAREGGNFIFGPYPDSAYTVKGIYYKKLDALSASNETNWFTTNAPDLLLAASMYCAYLFLKNTAKAEEWRPIYLDCINSVQEQDNGEWLSGSSPVSTVSWG